MTIGGGDADVGEYHDEHESSVDDIHELLKSPLQKLTKKLRKVVKTRRLLQFPYPRPVFSFRRSQRSRARLGEDDCIFIIIII